MHTQSEGTASGARPGLLSLQVRELHSRLLEERMAVRAREAEAAALEARLQRLVHVLVGSSRALAAAALPGQHPGGIRLRRSSSEASTEARG